MGAIFFLLTFDFVRSFVQLETAWARSGSSLDRMARPLR
jgi:hypothetical protein